MTNSINTDTYGQVVWTNNECMAITYNGSASFHVMRLEGDKWYIVGIFADYAANGSYITASRIAQKYIEQNYGLD